MPGVSYNYSSFLTLKPSLPLPLVPQRRVCCQANAREEAFKNKSNRWFHHHHHRQKLDVGFVRNRGEFLKLEQRSRPSSSSGNLRLVCNAFQKGGDPNGDNTGVLKLLLWAAEGIYIVWLFLLPYAPGDPVWAISSDTVNSLVGLSLNFFFILPLMNSVVWKAFLTDHNIFSDLLGRVVGIHLLEAPVLHPMSEGLFNFVIGWTFMFAPLLFTDRKRNRYKGSLDVLWGFQMFLTNTFLIPYMAIRLNEADANDTPKETSKLGSLMTKGAPIVGLVGGAVCLLCIYWVLFGRMDGNFGTLTDRWEYLISYLGSDRLAYAFIWDICLYIIFQLWLIGDNLDNVEESKVELVNKLRFLPVVGLVAYLVSLDPEKEF